MENGKLKWHGGKNEKNIKAIKEFFNQTNKMPYKIKSMQKIKNIS